MQSGDKMAKRKEVRINDYQFRELQEQVKKGKQIQIVEVKNGVRAESKNA